MSCTGKSEAERFSDLALERFVLGVMSGEERERLARHLEGCPHCRLQIEGKQASEEQFAGTLLPATLPAVFLAKLGPGRRPGGRSRGRGAGPRIHAARSPPGIFERPGRGGVCT